MRRIIRSTWAFAICAALPVLAASAVVAAPISALVPSTSWASVAASDVETIQLGKRGAGRALGARSGRTGRGVGGLRGNRRIGGRRAIGGNRGGRGRRGNFGRNTGIGLGAAIIGGIILSESARAAHRRDHGSDWDRCAATYRSFEWNTGMYTGYDGIRRTCPYLN